MDGDKPGRRWGRERGRGPGEGWRTSALVDDELGVDDDATVVVPFSPGEPKDDNEGDDGDDSARGGADAGILNGFGEGIEPRESRLGRHVEGRRKGQTDGWSQRPKR